MSAEYLIPPGPGHLDQANSPYGVHAFVGLTLEYHNMHPSDTRAILHLKATDVDEGIASVDIGMELTEGALETLAATILAVLVAVKEDDA